MLSQLLGKELQRKRGLVMASPGVMFDYLATPLPSKKANCAELEIVSLDLETTGLDPRKNHILSFGLVTIKGLTIQLSTTRHEVIKVPGLIPEDTAVIHSITDDVAAEGRPLEEVLPDLLPLLAGKVLLAHYAQLEQRFLDAACRKLYGAPFVARTIDTLVLARRLFERRNHTIQARNLRLFNLRPLYNLPQYKAHNALSDAVATAELFLAMAAEMFPNHEDCRLDRFLAE